MWYHIVVDQSPSHVQLFVAQWTTAWQASLSFTISWSWWNSCPLSRWCHPTISSSVPAFSSCPQSFPASGIFSSESALHIRWPKYWNFIFSISPSNEKSGCISFMIDGFDLLDVPGTLRSLLQHLSLKVSILQISPSLCSKSHIHTWLLEKP